MKRKTILTTVFSILGSIVLISGCGAGKTASAGGGVESAPDCTQACIQSCSDSCEACYPAGSIADISLVEGETASTHNVSVVSAYATY